MPRAPSAVAIARPTRRPAPVTSAMRSASSIVDALRATCRRSRRASTRASCCSSHDSGTRMTPSTRGPSIAPCQSEPPLGTRPKNSASAPRRFVSSLRMPGMSDLESVEPERDEPFDRPRVGHPVPGARARRGRRRHERARSRRRRTAGASATYAGRPAPRYRSNASRESRAQPPSINTRARCGRPIAASPARASTSSNEIGTPSSLSFATICSRANVAAVAERPKRVLERARPLNVQTEQVDLALAVGCAQLDARHDANAELSRRRRRASATPAIVS